MWKILNVIIQLYTVYLVSISISFTPLKLLFLVLEVFIKDIKKIIHSS